jgi:hypothetical protein
MSHSSCASTTLGELPLFTQVSGCSLPLFGVAERPRPETRLDVVVELELVRVRAHLHGEDLVGALVVDPVLHQASALERLRCHQQRRAGEELV